MEQSNTFESDGLKKTPSQNKEKLLQEKQNLKFKMELELFSGGINDEQFISNYLKIYQNINLSQYSPETRQKIIDEIRIVLDELRKFDAKKVEGLRKVREYMTIGLESGKDDNYYRSMLIGDKIKMRLILVEEAIKTLQGEKIQIGNRFFNKKDYGDFLSTFSQLDSKNGLSMEKKIMRNLNGNLKQIFAEELQNQIDPSNPNYHSVMSDITILSKIIGGKGFENLKQLKLKNGQTVNAQELYYSYNVALKTFRMKNNIFDLGNRQLQNTKKGFGFQNALYGVGYKKLEEAYADKLFDIEKTSVADAVIMLRVLASAVPVLGDILGGLDDAKQAKEEVSYDGKMFSLGENIMLYLSAGLQLSLVGGTISKLEKGPKYIRIITRLQEVIHKLSQTENISELAKNKKIMELIEKMGVIFPEAKDLSEKIKQAQKTSSVSVQKVLENAGLSSEKRLELASKFLGKKVSQETDLGKLIMHLHENVSKGVYANSPKELRIMSEQLKKQGVTKEQVRVLMENGVLGSVQEFLTDIGVQGLLSRYPDIAQKLGKEVVNNHSVLAKTLVSKLDIRTLEKLIADGMIQSNLRQEMIVEISRNGIMTKKIFESAKGKLLGFSEYADGVCFLSPINHIGESLILFNTGKVYKGFFQKIEKNIHGQSIYLFSQGKNTMKFYSNGQKVI